MTIDEKAFKPILERLVDPWHKTFARDAIEMYEAAKAANAGSSSGRTPDFESDNGGSSPPLATTRQPDELLRLLEEMFTRTRIILRDANALNVVQFQSEEVLDLIQQAFEHLPKREVEQSVGVTSIDRFSNGRISDLNIVQKIAGAICKAIMAKNPEFRGKGLMDATNAAVDILDEYFTGLPKREPGLPVHVWKDSPGVKTTPVKCLLCNSDAVVIAYAPNGCTCSPNKIQPRCAQHLHRAWDTEEDITIIEDFILEDNRRRDSNA